jgi:two-component system nitrogen regulation response regulator GlnG
VRQLENICHWLTVMAPAQMIDAKDLPPELLSIAPVELPATAPAAATSAAPPQVDAVPPSAAASGVPAAPAAAGNGWLSDLDREARSLLEAGVPDVWDSLTRKFEAQMIHAALDITRGRRIEAAHKLGIGRNTITRKIQDLGLDD